MTTAEMKVKALADAESLVAEINKAISAGDLAQIRSLEDKIDTAVSDYAEASQKEIFDHCLSAPDPMIEAVKVLTFETIRVKDDREKGAKIVLKKLETNVKKPIDLLKLHKTATDGIGADREWNYFAEKMNFLLTAKACVDLGINPKAVNDSYAMAEIAAKIDMGKTPTSNSQLLKALQIVVSAMIGDEYKATSHDVAFLNYTYAKKSRAALTISCSNHRNFRNLMAEVCHRIVTGSAYSVEFKAKSNG